MTAQLALLRALAPEEWGETRKVRVDGAAAPVGSGPPPRIVVIEHPDRAPRDLDEIIRELEDNQSTSGETRDEAEKVSNPPEFRVPHRQRRSRAEDGTRTRFPRPRHPPT